jgi:hypothetical protein
MSVAVNCPHCSRSLTVSAAQPGATCHCPACGGAFVLPAAPAPPAAAGAPAVTVNPTISPTISPVFNIHGPGGGRAGPSDARLDAHDRHLQRARSDYARKADRDRARERLRWALLLGLLLLGIAVLLVFIVPRLGR